MQSKARTQRNRPARFRRALAPLLALLFGARFGCIQPQQAVRGGDLRHLATVQTGAWKRKGPTEEYSRSELPLLVGKPARHLVQFGVETAQAARFHKGEVTVDLTVFCCSTSSEAYGVFTVLRTISGIGHASEVGSASWACENTLVVWQGPFVLLLKGAGGVPVSERELRALAAILLSGTSGKSTTGVLVSALPHENLSEDSILCFRTSDTLRLIQGIGIADSLSLDQHPSSRPHAQGVYAQYVYEENDAELLIILYREARTAARVGEDLVMKTYRPAARTVRRKKLLQEVQLRDGSWTVTVWRGPLLLVALPTRARLQVENSILRYLDRLARLLEERETQSAGEIKKEHR